MENNHSTQHSPKSSYSKQAWFKQCWGKPAKSSFLLELIKYYPWLVWIGVSTFLAALIVISVHSLTQTGYVKDTPEPKPVIANSNQNSQKRNPISWWLIGVVALGCSAGGVAIAKRVPISQLLKTRQQFKSSFKRARTRRQQRKLLLQDNSVIDTSSVTTLPEDATLETSFLLQESLEPKADLQAEQILLLQDDQTLNVAQESETKLLSEVTVLPPENKTLDSKTQSLAQMMDIRKKLPLSALLGENFQETKDSQQKKDGD